MYHSVDLQIVFKRGAILGRYGTAFLILFCCTSVDILPPPPPPPPQAYRCLGICVQLTGTRVLKHNTPACAGGGGEGGNGTNRTFRFLAGVSPFAANQIMRFVGCSVSIYVTSAGRPVLEDENAIVHMKIRCRNAKKILIVCLNNRIGT